MSGGVDSSVAAARARRAGLRRGRRHDEALLLRRRRSRPPLLLARLGERRAPRLRALGVPHYVLNLETAFSRDVVDDFVSEYALGRTPIPCVRCNTFTKFRDLVHKADAHRRALDRDRTLRARRRRRAASRRSTTRRTRAISSGGSTARVLSRMLLPVGGLTKAETRARARALGLDVVAREAGEPGHLLRPRRRSREDHRRGSAPTRRRCAGRRS